MGAARPPREPRKIISEFRITRLEPSELVICESLERRANGMETEKGINCGGGESGLPPQRQEKIKQIKGRRETRKAFLFYRFSPW